MLDGIHFLGPRTRRPMSLSESSNVTAPGYKRGQRKERGKENGGRHIVPATAQAIRH